MSVSKDKGMGIFAVLPASRYAAAILFAFIGLILHADPALAVPAPGPTVNDVADSMVGSVERLPGLISAFAYILGTLLGIMGIFKLRDHVENPTQTPLRVGIIRLLIGGMLFALPVVYEAAFRSFNGAGPNAELDFDSFTISQAISGMMGTVAGFLPTMNINEILARAINSLNNIPGVISAAAYILGLLFGLLGVLKLREHVENPEQVPLKDVIVRLLTAGALFALPTIYNAMFDVVGGNDIGVVGIVTSLIGSANFFFSSYARDFCNPLGGIFGTSMGSALCSVWLHTAAIPAFLTAVAYVIGLVFGLWGIFKIKAHVQNPQQVGLWEGISRFIAGGAFFALPIVIEVARTTFTPLSLTAIATVAPISRYNTTGCPGAAAGPLPAAPAGPMGLDGVVTCFMSDMMAPTHVVLNFFCFCVGIVFLMIGVSRLIRSAQDGARGPGGLGTIMTFVTGASLISYNEMVRAFSTTLFSNPVTLTYATLQYTTGMLDPEIAAAHAVITAIIQFVIIVGLISFVRGIFIVRSVAEGNSQASIMSGITHMIAGALAVNLGPLLNAVQSTLGIGGFGITFGV